MPRKWTKEEKTKYRKELEALYIKKNLTIFEVAKILDIKWETVFDRLKRLNIKTVPHLKENYLNKRKFNQPDYSEELAEFIGIMCGDGHLSDGQVVVHLGSKEEEYANYIRLLFKKTFNQNLKVSIEKHTGYRNLYIGFVELVRFLKEMGLVGNKVKDQVQAPRWIYKKTEYIRGFIRGFFDTDGSVYKLRWGNQISFCNRSLRLLKDIRKILKRLGFSPSKISIFNMYLTQRPDLVRFYREIGSNNPKKSKRLNDIFLKIDGCVG